jgi:diaminopimelate decarboxylase
MTFSVFMISRSNNVSDFTSQLAELGPQITCGSFGEVYQCTVVTNEGETVVCPTIPNSSDVRLSNIHQVAVKKIMIDCERAVAKIEKVKSLNYALSLGPFIH